MQLNKWKNIILLLFAIGAMSLLFYCIFKKTWLTEGFDLASYSSILTKNAAFAFIADSSSVGGGNWVDKTTNANKLVLTDMQYTNHPNLGSIVVLPEKHTGLYSPSIVGLKDTTDFTVIFWMYFFNKPSDKTVLMTLNRSPRNYVNQLVINTSGLYDYGRYSHRIGSKTGFNTSFAQTPYTEAQGGYQLAFVKKGRMGYWYVNGNLCGAPFKSNYTINYGYNDLSVGYDRRDKSGSLGAVPIKGIFMYNTAFSASDILFNNARFRRISSIMNPSGLVLMLASDKRDSIEGTTWKNLASNNQTSNATMVNCKVVNTGFGGNESRIEFDGSTSYITIPKLENIPEAGVSNITIMFWLYVDNVSESSKNILFSINREKGTADGSLECGLNSFTDYDSGSGKQTINYINNSKNTSIKYAGYYHVAFVRDANPTNQGPPVFSYYVNGNSVYNKLLSSGLNYRNTNICIGGLGEPSTNNFKGAIHSVFVYNKALNPEEITSNYDRFLERINTWSPDNLDIISSPTGSVITSSPTGSLPTGSLPTRSITSSPNDLPTGSFITSSPTGSFITSSPTDLPTGSFITSSSTGSFVTGSSSDLPTGSFITSSSTGSFVTGSSSDLPTGSFITDLPTGSFIPSSSTGSFITSSSTDLPTGSFITSSPTGSFITSSSTDLPTGSLPTGSQSAPLPIAPSQGSTTGSLPTGSQSARLPTVPSQGSPTWSLPITGSSSSYPKNCIIQVGLNGETKIDPECAQTSSSTFQTNYATAYGS